MHNHQGIMTEVSCQDPIIETSSSFPIINSSIASTQVQYKSSSTSDPETLTSYQYLVSCGNTTQLSSELSHTKSARALSALIQ